MSNFLPGSFTLQKVSDVSFDTRVLALREELARKTSHRAASLWWHAICHEPDSLSVSLPLKFIPVSTCIFLVDKTLHTFLESHCSCTNVLFFRPYFSLVRISCLYYKMSLIQAIFWWSWYRFLQTLPLWTIFWKLSWCSYGMNWRIRITASYFWLPIVRKALYTCKLSVLTPSIYCVKVKCNCHPSWLFLCKI